MSVRDHRRKLREIAPSSGRHPGTAREFPETADQYERIVNRSVGRAYLVPSPTLVRPGAVTGVVRSSRTEGRPVPRALLRSGRGASNDDDRSDRPCRDLFGVVAEEKRPERRFALAHDDGVVVGGRSR